MYNLNIYLKYLRKSREDEEFEKNNTGYRTLERHNERLKYLENATGKIVHEENIYEEVVSGDSIEARPVIQQLLKDIEDPHVKGVWVIDVQRLCRGDLGDQDRIIKAFKYTNTMILTPEKEYDLSNPIDEELLIDKLSYSRKEYNNIKKRLIEGRKDSIMSGCFLGNAPFGYERIKLKGRKGWTLKIIDEQAEIIKLIFKKCLENKGTGNIANELNQLNIKPPVGKEWRPDLIRYILKNETYIGLVKYQKQKKIGFMENGKIKYRKVYQQNYFTTKGLHDSIILEEDFKKAQIKLKESSEKFVKPDAMFQYAFAGILRCKKCGLVMCRHATFYRLKDGSKRDAKPQVRCPNYKKCGTVSHRLEEVENVVLSQLNEWMVTEKKILEDYDKNKDALISTTTNKLALIEDAINKENFKINRIRDLLEDGTYTKEIYQARINPIFENLKKLENNKNEIISKDETTKMNHLKILIPKIENLFKNYNNLNVTEKNNILHSILERIDYEKTGRYKESNLKLQIYPKV